MNGPNFTAERKARLMAEALTMYEIFKRMTLLFSMVARLDGDENDVLNKARTIIERIDCGH